MPDSGLPGGWRSARLGDVATVETGGTPSRKNPEYWRGAIRWMSSGEVNQRRVKDTAETITEAGVAGNITHVSTGGGASLEFLAGDTLPGVAALTDKRTRDKYEE